MREDWHQAFKSIGEIEPNPKLGVLLLSKIEFLKKRQVKKKLLLSYFSLATSFSFFLLTVFGYGNALVNSDFWDFIKLISTDTEVVFGNLGDFVFLLLETFPFMSLIMILIPVFALLLSLSVYSKSIEKNHYNYI